MGVNHNGSTKVETKLTSIVSAAGGAFDVGFTVSPGSSIMARSSLQQETSVDMKVQTLNRKRRSFVCNDDTDLSRPKN